MENTEKNGILKQVRDVESAVTETLDKPGLTRGERNVLDNLLAVLRDIDNLILLNDLKGCIEDLRGRSKKLRRINTEIKKKIDNFENISVRVEQTSKTIDSVIKAFRLLI